MHPFRVWIRPMGDFCRVRVDGVGNAQWLLQRLGGSFVFATFEPLRELANSTCCTFDIPYNPPLSRAGFQRLLGGIAEVQLMREPA